MNIPSPIVRETVSVKPMQRIMRIANRFLEVRMGIVGAIFMGAVVYAINMPHGALMALSAATKQSVYSFWAGGVMMRTSERLAVCIRRRGLALFLGAFVPSV